MVHSLSCNQYALFLANVIQACELSALSEGEALKHIDLNFGVQNYSCVHAGANPTAAAALVVLYNVTGLYPGQDCSSLCFSHISFIEYYWSNDNSMVEIRDCVDSGFNCEDIALIFVQRLLAGRGPCISSELSHLEARRKCLNRFTTILKCMPLVGRIFRI
uniref:Uncharacterized protein n=1 Tax=Gibberella zeae TaxID=5518 RepID=A0A4E9EIK0_GIBZA